jgi:hypothetical protein
MQNGIYRRIIIILAVLSVITIPVYCYATWFFSMFDVHRILGIKSIWFHQMPMLLFLVAIFISAIKYSDYIFILFPLYAIFYLEKI